METQTFFVAITCFLSIMLERKLETTATNSLPTNNNVSASSFSAKDISDMRNDFVQKQQALQPIKPTPSF